MVEIRFAKNDDYELIKTIDSSINYDLWKKWTDNKQAVLAFMGGSFAGWLQYSMFSEKTPFLNRLYIIEKYQKNSLGTGLMKFWEFEMVEKGYKQLMLSTEEDNTAKDFYAKLGYRVLGKFDYFSNHNELILGKEPEFTTVCCCKQQ